MGLLSQGQMAGLRTRTLSPSRITFYFLGCKDKCFCEINIFGRLVYLLYESFLWIRIPLNLICSSELCVK